MAITARGLFCNIPSVGSQRAVTAGYARSCVTNKKGGNQPPYVFYSSRVTACCDRKMRIIAVTSSYIAGADIIRPIIVYISSSEPYHLVDAAACLCRGIGVKGYLKAALAAYRVVHVNERGGFHVCADKVL